SPQGVFGAGAGVAAKAAGAWANVRSMDTEMTAAAATATVVIELRNLSRMMVSFALQCLTATGCPIVPRNQRAWDGSVFRARPIGSFTPDFGTPAARNEVASSPCSQEGRTRFCSTRFSGRGV